jgi:xylonate dehydratase
VPPFPSPLDLPADTRLWAALQAVGGTWDGCVYDPDAIIATLEAGRAALQADRSTTHRP